MLRTQAQSSARAINALNHWTISLDPSAVFLEGNKLTICCENLIHCLIIYFSLGKYWCVERILLWGPHWPWTDSQSLKCYYRREAPHLATFPLLVFIGLLQRKQLGKRQLEAYIHHFPVPSCVNQPGNSLFYTCKYTLLVKMVMMMVVVMMVLVVTMVVVVMMVMVVFTSLHLHSQSMGWSYFLCGWAWKFHPSNYLSLLVTVPLLRFSVHLTFQGL